MTELKYPLFDGERLWDGATVTVEDGKILSVTACDPAECDEGLLIPGLIDAHTHIGTRAHIEAMLKAGITATCDVSASAELAEHSDKLEIIRSAGMAMGVVMNPKGYVEKAAANGARYIKVLLFNTLSIGKAALKGIVKAAHEKNLKVAVHATEISTYRQAVEAGADILLHVPMKEKFPEDLAKTIAEKGIAVAPTLVMMEAFARSGRNGYEANHYQNAENAVRLLHESGVKILAATDANPGSFVPAVGYGDTLHYEMKLLANAGLSDTEVLAAATGNVADAFGLTEIGRIVPGKLANLLLLEGRPDRCITDIRKIKKLWINGKSII